MKSAIENMFEAISQLIDRGSFFMAARTLEEVKRRIMNGNVSLSEYEQYLALCRRIPELETEGLIPTHNKQPKCHKCKGSGTFSTPSASGKCYACLGKGWQTVEDVLREIDYWERRERETRERREVSKKFNPF